MRPFQFSNGRITRDAYKAMRLQLDPDDDEAERAVRMAVEKQSEKEIAAALRAQMNELIPTTATDFEVASAASRVSQTSGGARDALRRALARGADLGVSAAVDQFENIGFGFDWTLANQHAADWANAEAGKLITRIDSVTQRRVQTAVNEWVTNGEPLSALRRELTPTFGPQRAKTISTTETTRAYAEGNKIAYRESGVVDKVEIRVSNDELVCPICGPVSGKRVPLETGHPELGFPPFHVNCRCWIAPVVETRAERERN